MIEQTVGTPQVRARLEWMDVCRGVCMILVILLHSTSYYKFNDGIVPPFVTQIVNALAPVRMPTLFFLSGVMVNFGLRKGRTAFLARRMRILVWPYLVWCVIWAFASGNVAEMAGYEWWLGGWYLWFLLFVALYSLAAAIIPPRYHAISASYLYLASLLMEDGTKYGERLLFFMAIFLLGSALGQNIPRLEKHLSDRRLLVLAPAGIGILLYSGLFGPVRYSPYDVGMIAIVVLLSLAFCHWIAGKFALRPLSAIGRNSITIYLVHMPVIALVIEAFRAIGLGSFTPVFLGSLLLSVLASLLALELRKRVPPVDWLFAFPSRGKGSIAPPARAIAPSSGSPAVGG